MDLNIFNTNVYFKNFVVVVQFIYFGAGGPRVLNHNRHNHLFQEVELNIFYTNFISRSGAEHIQNLCSFLEEHIKYQCSFLEVELNIFNTNVYF